MNKNNNMYIRMLYTDNMCIQVQYVYNFIFIYIYIYTYTQCTVHFRQQLKVNQAIKLVETPPTSVEPDAELWNATSSDNQAFRVTITFPFRDHTAHTQYSLSMQFC